jgi:hypothetical protein
VISTKLNWLLSLLCTLLLCGTLTASPTIVYDNTTTATSGTFVLNGLPDGFWPFNQIWPDEPMGDQITLAGTARENASIDLMLSSSQPTTLTSLTLSLCSLDADGYTPAGQFWSGSLQNVAVSGLTPVTFNITNLDAPLPTSFIWLASADSDVAGLATFNPPTVGSSGNFYWDHDPDDGSWYALAFGGSPVANFGATVTAMPNPEPTSIAFLLLGGLAVRGKQRRA